MTQEMPNKPTIHEQPVKIGYFESPDGSVVSYLQLRGLPNVDKAKEACEWLANLMLAATTPADKNEVN